MTPTNARYGNTAAHTVENKDILYRIIFSSVMFANLKELVFFSHEANVTTTL